MASKGGRGIVFSIADLTIAVSLKGGISEISGAVYSTSASREFTRTQRTHGISDELTPSSCDQRCRAAGKSPMKFEFVVNLNAAKQVGLTIPPNVLVRADKIIKLPTNNARIKLNSPTVQPVGLL